MSLIREIKITNKNVINVLNNTLTKDFLNGQESIVKGFDLKNYDTVLESSVSDETLNNHLLYDIPIHKTKYNKILGETEAGNFFYKNIKKFFDIDRLYTSGYIPKGFDRWHNDADIFGYAILFSYSKTGDGYLKYRDPNSNTIHTIKDSIGWMIRGMHYGNSSNTELWHCVASNCFRVTFIIMYDSIDKYNHAIEFIERV